MAGDLLARWPVATAQLAGHILPRLGQKSQYGLVAFLALVLRVVALAPTHLLAVEGVHRRIGVQGRRLQLHVGCFPYATAHLALHRQDLLRYTAVQRCQKAPQRALGGSSTIFNTPVRIGSRAMNRSWFRRLNPMYKPNNMPSKNW